jgi:hypothetical protein
MLHKDIPSVQRRIEAGVEGLLDQVGGVSAQVPAEVVYPIRTGVGQM